MRFPILYIGKVFIQAFYGGQTSSSFSHLSLGIFIFKALYGVRLFKCSGNWESTVLSQFHNPGLIRMFTLITCLQCLQKQMLNAIT